MSDETISRPLSYCTTRLLKASPALTVLTKGNRVDYDIYSYIADTKALFLKYCKLYEKRIHSMILTPRVVPAGDGADPTSVSIPGFLFDAKAKAKKAFAHMQVEMQFLDTHENLHLELHRDFSKVAYAPQSEASWQNFISHTV